MPDFPNARSGLATRGLLPRDPTDITPAPPGGQVCLATLTIKPGGGKVYSPFLDCRRLYAITVSGEFSWGVANSWDAFESHSFGELFLSYDPHRSHDCLLVNDEPATLLREHFQKSSFHEYVIHLDGHGARLSFELLCPDSHTRESLKGQLTVAIDVFGAGARSLAELARVGAEQRQRAREERDRARQENERRRAAERLAPILRPLQLRAHLERDFMDPEFRERFARRHWMTILGNLRDQWEREEGDLVREPYSESIAEDVAPEVLELLEARRETVRLAYKFSVEPLDEPPAAPPLQNRGIHDETIL